jgi:hypothetical protein
MPATATEAISWRMGSSLFLRNPQPISKAGHHYGVTGWSLESMRRIISPHPRTGFPVGARGGLIGSWVASNFGYHNANGGVAWIPFFIGVGAAIIVIAIWETLTGRRTRTRLPR